MRKLIIFVVSLFYISSITAQINPTYEFRAVWIATVENIDWPSRKGLPAEQQKSEFIRILDMHKRNGMNAIVMQIRPATDAFFPSKYEPWSEYLNGKQGLPPTPYYDPLQFMIEETHKRGMEFHAWINPYRAVFNVTKSSVAASHVTRLFPQWFVTYGSTKYFNPGLPEVREHVNRVIKDLVERYDLDAVHFDDYFYPYKIPGKDFPDQSAYAMYGNGMAKDDWRRSNVDTIIKMLSETIKTTNPRVKFGISPFGVWRNKSKDSDGSDTRAGVTNYDDLYADILLWLREGWIDYVAPQLYWEIGFKVADYPVLLDWWSKHTYGKQLFIGHGIYRALEAKSLAWKQRDQIPNQIKLLRENPDVNGSIYFSSNTFSRNPNGWNDSLKNNYYKNPAIIPPMSWIDSIAPLEPLIENLKNDEVRIFYRGSEPIKGFAFFTIKSGRPSILQSTVLQKIVVETKVMDIELSSITDNSTDKIYVAAIDRNNNLSQLVPLR